VKIIRQTYNINAPIERVWRALVDPQIIDQWGGGPVKMSAKEEEEFEFWGGDIYGKNTKVVKEKELVQEWRSKELKEPTKVTFKLKAEGNKTKLELIHENLPDDQAKNFDDGWRNYFLGPLKELVEKGK